MLRIILGIFAGFIAAAVIVLAIESLGHLIFPPPPGIDLANPEALASIIDQLPIGALVAVIIAWFAGAFGGGATAAKISRLSWSAWVVGTFMLAGGLWSMLVIPHPLWMKLALAPATLVPAWLAGRMFARPLMDIAPH
ncbi:MAG: hypothetical protein R3D57_07265 [Hyphomicrobiaceae bacterium]